MPMSMNISETTFLRLLQLSSATLPVGAYAFSQGMETAIEKSWLTDANKVSEWLAVQITESQALVDIPLLYRLMLACNAQQDQSLKYWNAYALACRETSELRLNDTALALALVRLVEKLDISLRLPESQLSYLTVFAAVAAYWQIPVRQAASGYLWAWLENQVAAATKLVPLGQFQAQNILADLLQLIPPAVDKAEKLEDQDIGASLPTLAMMSSWHERQYSRLFRS